MSQLSELSREEIAKVLAARPVAADSARDPSNRVSGKPEAIALRRAPVLRAAALRHRLGAVRDLPRAVSRRSRMRARAPSASQEVDRNTPSCSTSRFYRWYGWDGAHDSLWAQSIRPLLDPREMRSTPAHVARAGRTRSSPATTTRRSAARGPRTMTSRSWSTSARRSRRSRRRWSAARTPFDEFRDALARARPQPRGYPLAAQRGLRIFVGKGNCSTCHSGPHFTNGEFADTGMPFFVAPGKVDAGRLDGLKKLKKQTLTTCSAVTTTTRRAAQRARHAAMSRAQHRNFGEFRVPGLRNVAQTAPYMHNGSLATLRDVVRHYSELNEERLHADGESILQAAGLTPRRSTDLVAFLESLSAAKR